MKGVKQMKKVYTVKVTRTVTQATELEIVARDNESPEDMVLDVMSHRPSRFDWETMESFDYNAEVIDIQQYYAEEG